MQTTVLVNGTYFGHGDDKNDVLMRLRQRFGPIIKLDEHRMGVYCGTLVITSYKSETCREGIQTLCVV
jgi:ABC-type arginine transport system permease subunit